MIRKISRSMAALMALLFLAACVTVNIYFPAAEVSRTADQIVEDVYAAPEGGNTAPQGAPSSSLTRMLASLLSPAVAHAQQETTVSNAAIRGLKDQIAQNHQQLVPFYNSGNVGIAADGSLALRNNDGLSVQQVASVQRIIAADNAARRNLYAEVARALNTTETGRVQAVFARTWRDKAQSGWWIQEDNGAWRQK